jgi:hypothetical protein
MYVLCSCVCACVVRLSESVLLACMNEWLKCYIMMSTCRLPCIQCVHIINRFNNRAFVSLVNSQKLVKNVAAASNGKTNCFNANSKPSELRSLRLLGAFPLPPPKGLVVPFQSCGNSRILQYRNPLTDNRYQPIGDETDPLAKKTRHASNRADLQYPARLSQRRIKCHHSVESIGWAVSTRNLYS